MLKFSDAGHIELGSALMRLLYVGRDSDLIANGQCHPDPVPDDPAIIRSPYKERLLIRMQVSFGIDMSRSARLKNDQADTYPFGMPGGRTNDHRNVPVLADPEKIIEDTVVDIDGQPGSQRR